MTQPVQLGWPFPADHRPDVDHVRDSIAAFAALLRDGRLPAIDSYKLAEWILWLDAHLRAGGALPTAWAADATAHDDDTRPVADIPLPDLRETGLAVAAWVRANADTIRQALFDAEDYRREYDLPAHPDRDYVRVAEQFSEMTT